MDGQSNIEGKKINPFEIQALLIAMRTLALIDIDDSTLTDYDRLSDYVQREGGFLSDASRQCAIPITAKLTAMLLLTYLYHWHDDGAEAALALSNPESDVEIGLVDNTRDSKLIRQMLAVLSPLAFANLAGSIYIEEDWSEAGNAMLELVMTLLEERPDQSILAADAALAAHALLGAAGDSKAGLADALAYRILVWSQKRPFLADLPPSKYPPPLVPKYPSEVFLDLGLCFIQEGVLDQAIDLGQVARESLNDSDSVIHNQITIVLDGTQETLRVELSFSPGILKWALDDSSPEVVEFGLNAHLKLTAMLQRLCENRLLLEHHRDELLFDWHVLAYLGTKPLREREFGLVLMVMPIGQLVRFIVGLSEADLSQMEILGQAVRPRREDLLASINTKLRGG